MINPPKTLEEARGCRYGTNSYNTGKAYCNSQCAYEVWEQGRCIAAHQCHRKNGHGVEKLYCKQHAKKLSERK